MLDHFEQSDIDMTHYKKPAVLTVFFSLAAFWSPSCFPADAPAPQGTILLSQEAFEKQRETMLRDLEKKIVLMQQAKDCAEKSTTPVAFQACNQAFLEGVQAHIAEMKKSK